MNTLNANLKHLYQRKGCWVINLALAVSTIPGIQAVLEGNHTAFLIFPAWMYFAAIFTAPLQIEVLIKPFSWSLPGHSRIPAKILFTMGTVLSLFWAILFLAYPAYTVSGHLLNSLSVFFLATIIYWIGVSIVFKFANWIGAMAFFPIVLIAGDFLQIHKLFELLVIDYWYSLLLIAPIVNFLAWRGLTKPGLARKYCTQIWMGAFDAWNKGKISQFNQARLVQKNKNNLSGNPLVDNFFLKRISRLPAMNTSNYIWGSLYGFFGLVLSRKKDWLKFVITYVPLICFLGYLSPGSNILFFVPGIMVTNINLGVRSSLLISGGRKERFFSSLTLAVAIALSITAIATLLAAATFPLEAIMPELTINNQQYVFQTIDLRLFVVPLIMIPITFTIALIFYKHPRLMLACVMLPFLLLFQISIFAKIFKIIPITPGPIHIAIILITCWAIFTAVLNNICKKRALVK